MKLKMHDNSLFALLLRSGWWWSALLAAGVIAAVRMFVPTVYAVFAALPFIVISAIVGWRQLRSPSAKSIEATLARLRSLSSEQFAVELEAALKREGYGVTRIAHAHADYELEEGGRKLLLACKRWKATRTGAEPLRELKEACRTREDCDGIYVSAVDVTDKARAFAAENRIELIEAQGLAKLLR